MAYEYTPTEQVLKAAILKHGPSQRTAISREPEVRALGLPVDDLKPEISRVNEIVREEKERTDIRRILLYRLRDPEATNDELRANLALSDWDLRQRKARIRRLAEKFYLHAQENDNDCAK